MAAAVVEESAAGEVEGAGAVRPHRGGGGGSERPNDHPEPRSNRPKQPVCGVAVGRTGGGSITAVGLGVEAGAANIGFAGEQVVLERVQTWLPAAARVRLLADRFYPSAALFEWLHRHGWQYRLQLKGNLTVDTGDQETT